jgi:hypothetical protein
MMGIFKNNFCNQTVSWSTTIHNLIIIYVLIDRIDSGELYLFRQGTDGRENDDKEFGNIILYRQYLKLSFGWLL